MPLYEFYCQSCDRNFDIRRTFSQGLDGVVCNTCSGENVKRVFSPVAAFSRGSNGASTAVAGSSKSCSSCSTTGGCAGCSCH